MRPHTRLLLVLCLAACGTAPEKGSTRAGDTAPEAAGASDDPFLANGSVIFYNVENLFDTRDDPQTHDEDFTPNGENRWNEERYQQKLVQLARAIGMAGEAPLLIGLAEVENKRVVTDLANTGDLANAHYTVVHRDSPDERGIDVALLVRPEAGNVGEVRMHHVDLPGGDRTRDILQVTIEPKSGPVLNVFVNHWPSRGEGVQESAPKRMSAARALRKAVQALLDTDADAQIIIMGDLNDTPTDASVQKGLKASVNANDVDADLVGLVAFDNGAYPGSVARDGRWSYFDQMIVSRGFLRAEGGTARVAANSLKVDALIFHHPRYGDQPNRTFSGRGKYHPNGFSDHLPVVLHAR
jgi:endonuclease/exonuclease/phosphatase family metal-dependent hydrolase